MLFAFNLKDKESIYLYKQIDNRETGRQTGRQTDRSIHTHTHTHMFEILKWSFACLMLFLAGVIIAILDLVHIRY